MKEKRDRKQANKRSLELKPKKEKREKREKGLVLVWGVSLRSVCFQITVVEKEYEALSVMTFPSTP